jgi:hypothetical protein
MKKHFVLYFILIIVSSCSKKLSIYKKHYSNGYHIDVVNNKKKNTTPTQSITKRIIDANKSEIIIQDTSIYKTIANKEAIEKTYPIAPKINNEQNLKVKASNDPIQINNTDEKESTSTSKVHIPVIIKSNENQKTTPFNGFMFDMSSNIWYTLGAIMAFIFTVLVIIFIISIFKALAFSLIFIYPILIFIGIIVLLTLSLLVIFNTN